MINNYLASRKLVVLNRYLHLLVIIIFEFFGTLIFAYCTYNMVNLKSQGKSIYLKIVYFFLDFSLSMLIVISYGRQFSGGLFNPAVAFFRIFRKTQRYPVKIAILYMVCQFLGAIVGCFLALGVNNVEHAPITSYLPWQIQLKHIATDALGTMVLTFMVQLVSEKKMTYIEHNRQFYVVLPIYYLIARSYSSKSNGVNPAFGIGFELVYCFKYDTWGIFYQSYIFIVAPFLGALLSVILFQYGMRPMYPMKKQTVINAVIKKKRKEQIELKMPVKKVNTRWTASEVLNEQKYAPIGDEYDFVAIAEQDIDDQIRSLSDEEQQQSLAPMQTELQRQIRNSQIVTNQFDSSLLQRKSIYGDSQLGMERKQTFLKSIASYSFKENQSIQQRQEQNQQGL